MTTHPNTTAGGLAGAIGILIVFALGEAGVDVSPELAAAISTVCATVVLFIGRRFGGQST
ncbi:MAG: hypothetical protein ACRDM7_13090 [Thermoleophilaceae bacterium]